MSKGKTEKAFVPSALWHGWCALLALRFLKGSLAKDVIIQILAGRLVVQGLALRSKSLTLKVSFPLNWDKRFGEKFSFKVENFQGLSYFMYILKHRKLAFTKMSFTSVKIVGATYASFMPDLYFLQIVHAIISFKKA